jgi:hypothetical protein
LETCGKLVTIFCHCTTASEEEKYKIILKLLEFLRKVPCGLANDVTASLLRNLDSHWMRLNWPQEKKQVLAISAVHPKVQVIDITYCHTIWKDVMKAMTNLSQLLQRFPDCNAINVTVTATLKKFVFQLNCDDEILEAMKACTALEHLDVRESWEVTDRSCGTLLGLTKLKYLNVDGTSISRNGLSEILEAFCNINGIHPLCKFYCPDMSTVHLRLLINLKNLTHIGMGISEGDISVLKDLEYLKSVRLRGCKFDSLRENLRDIGDKLYDIRLEGIKKIDLKFIGETFPKLECLVLMNCSYRSLAPNERYESLPAFRRL